ncbi:CoA transferase [Salicibibacter cibarius]|uniref:CoA transferase n=1 Tax=Salicibibacter cibarius TaxID=2743000 RepID=A0A7T7CAY2_9BACI|nr:CoA transferase [Salicibibacter cibarius]QQK75377.1 CoA transferase [Salicibibacter cibarius]
MLNNVKVLSFTHFLQGPSAVQMLGDLGADVVKIENPKGAYERHWSGLNSFLGDESVFYLMAGRNQRSLSINLRTEEGKEIVKKMVADADVIVENFRPGVMERLGFGYQDVAKINPGIVYCSCTGFGSSGPYKDRPGQDLLVQAMSGIASLNGRKQDPPSPIGTAAVDQHAAVLAVVGVLAALYEREHTGKGKKVESNLLNAALDMQIEPFNYHLNKFHLYDRSETGISSRFHQAPYGVFETKDGYICISLPSLDKLAKALNDDQFLQWGYDEQFEKREEINQQVAMNIRQQTTNYWIDTFSEFDIWHSMVNDYEEVENDPQVEWNKNIMEFEHTNGEKVRVLSHPVRYDDETLPLYKLPPKLGEDTDEILKELNYADEDIADFKNKNVVESLKVKDSSNQ